MFHETIALRQGSEEWRQWRRQGITATDATVIAGVSPYVTPWRLCAEKLGLARERDLSGNPWVRRGHRLEDEARDHMADFLYERETPNEIRERAAYRLRESLDPCCLQVVQQPVFRASLDGLRNNGEPTELKVPSPRTFADVQHCGRESFAFKQYYPQVQHQLLVANAPRGWLMFYQPDPGAEPVCFEIDRDKAWLQWYIQRAREFWAYVVADSLPEKDPGRDVYYPENEQAASTWIMHARELHRLEKRRQQLKTQQSELEDRMRPHREALVCCMGEHRAGEYGGIRLSCSSRSKVDWEELIRREFGVEVSDGMRNRYSIPGKTSYRLTITGEGMPREILDPQLSRWIQGSIDEHGLVNYQPLPEDMYF